MRYVQAKGVLSASNGMNLYRGCQHGCVYCDSRSACYQINHDFEDVEVKENAVELLDRALRRKRHPCMVGTGSMSDPYMPLEQELGMTRQALEVIHKYGCGAVVQTKSDLVLRDLDLLRQINERSKAVVQMTLTTYDEKLCRILEPEVCTTQARFRALCACRDAGIPTVVWISPILPWINDSMENLDGILDYCIRSGVQGIICFGMGLTLREGNRGYFYQALDRYFPGLKGDYIRKYGLEYQLLSPQNQILMEHFHGVCQKSGIVHSNNEIFRYLRDYPDPVGTDQMRFW